MLEEAAHFLALIQDVDITCPVVLDMEQTQDGLTRARRTALCVAFLELLEQNGYAAMLYSYAGYFDNYLDAQQFEQFGLWVENYREEPAFGQRLWQYASAGRVNGIDGIVDINVSYGDLNRNKAG